MFEPETEDMLPRAAPKPSAASGMALNEVALKPAVPEVSILFGQDSSTGGGGGSAATQPVQQSYASWKKKVLPKVTFVVDGPTAGTGEQPRSSALYPMRPIASPPAQVPASTADYHRRAAETTMMTMSSGRSNYLQQQQRRSLETLSPRSLPTLMPPTDILTICAGTQTEITGDGGGGSLGVSNELLQHLATKEDLAQCYDLLEALHTEQQRLREVCEALLLSGPVHARQPTLCVRNATTQCSQDAAMHTNGRSRVSPLMQELIAEEAEDAVDKEGLPQPTHTYSPHPPTPVAQSTAYRANTPQQQQLQHRNTAVAQPKAATERTMVMTELARKYLPNDKLTELMQDLEVSPGGKAAQPPLNGAVCNAHSPLRGIENMEKGPAELSNASYKYLKKYRLLPEQAGARGGGDGGSGQQHSPYQRTQSPLAMANAAAHLEHYLDLEHIRKQPKFL